MNMNMSLTLKGKETVLFDELAGEMYQSSSKLTGQSQITAPGQTNDAGMQMTMSTNIVVTKADK